MDPNKCLEMLRDMSVKSRNSNVPVSDRLELLDDLAAQFEALDMWIMRGGFLPDGWSNARHPGERYLARVSE